MKVMNSEGEVFEASQYLRDADAPHPDVTMVARKDAAQRMNKDLNEVTKDVGYINVKGSDVPLTNGTWILTSKDGAKSLAHPLTFAAEYEEIV